MDRLEAPGTAQNRKVYPRHGVKGPLFGVRFADLRGLAKAVGTDQGMAEALWRSGNHDARVLATMVTEPPVLNAAGLDAWAAEADSYIQADALSDLVARSPLARDRMAAWLDDEREWVGRVGWSVLAKLLVRGEDFPAAELDAHIRTIETEIHGRRNRVRDAMLGALIAIGMQGEALEAKARVAATRIGPVAVDHGATGCRTPDVADYLRRIRAGRQGKVRNAGSRKGRTSHAAE
jgi:3-methyladenine DNA glycosylase AlkD